MAFQVLDHLCFLGKLKDKGHSSNEAAAALLLFDNSVEKVLINWLITTCMRKVMFLLHVFLVVGLLKK